MLAYMELGCAMPRSGGEKLYVRVCSQRYNPIPLFCLESYSPLPRVVGEDLPKAKVSGNLYIRRHDETDL